MSMGGQSSSSSSKSSPRDMTPPEIQALRGPFAQVVGSLLGFDPAAIMYQASQVNPGGVQRPTFAGGTVLGNSGYYTPDTRSGPGKMFGKKGDISTFLGTGIPIPGGPTAGGPIGSSGGAGGAGTGGGPLGNSILAGIPAWQGPFNAGIAPGEQLMLEQLMANQMGERNPLLEKTMAGYFLPGQEGANPFLEAAIAAAQRPTMQGLQETLDRALPGRFALAGQTPAPRGSSAFDRAAALATRDAGQTMADIATKMSFEGYESERGRQMEAVKLSQTEVDTMIKNLQAQALPRLIEDLGIERGIAEFQGRITALLNVLATVTGSPMISLGTASQSKSESSGFSFGIPLGG